MTRGRICGPSALALFALGVGRAGAVPTMAVSAGIAADTIDRSDVVRQSLSIGAPVRPEPRTAGAPEAAPTFRPTIADLTRQTPTAAFTYRPAVPVRGDAGLVGTLAPGIPRNPGNVSNLTGAAGGGSAGIFSVPARAIGVNVAPAFESDYLFRPFGSIASHLSSTELVPREPGRAVPSRSVFIGLPPAFGDATAERAAREASIISATGSATPTVRLTPLPGQPGARSGLAYQVDAGLTTTIGFSTADLPASVLPPGSAATSTLGYTYVPFAPPASESPQPGALPASVAAPGDGSARRIPVRAPEAGPPPAIVSTASGVLPLVPDAPPVIPVDAYPIALGGIFGTQRLTLPIRVRGVLALEDRGDRSLLAADENETAFDSLTLLYVLLGIVVTVPPAIAILIHRLIRRAVLRRLGGEPPA